MIGNAKWFTMRKYTGWGIRPVSWQGWLYMAGLFIPFIFFFVIPGISMQTGFIASIIWLVVISLDTLDIMITLKKDEREQSHEALAERNALWAMVTLLSIGIFYQILQSIYSNTLMLDPFIIGALLSATVVKALSYRYLRDK